jgi:hypothetical protein
MAHSRYLGGESLEVDDISLRNVYRELAAIMVNLTHT